MTRSRASGPNRIAAIIPVGTLEGAKTRLGETLDAEERQDLTERLLTGTIGAVLGVGRLADVLVVSPDREVLRLAADLGARTLRQRSAGLNAGLAEARDDVVAGGADGLLVIPIDLAFVNADSLAGMLEPLARTEPGPLVVLAPDRHGTGTNALAMRPPGAIDFAFGPDSRRAHQGAAETAGCGYVEVEGPLSVDIDTPADLILVESLAPERIGAS